MDNFEWIGEPVQRYNLNSKKWFDYYGGFTYNSTTFQIGDFVLIKQKNKLNIGKLQSLFRSYEKYHISKEHRGILQVYKRVKDLDARLLCQYPDLNHAHEIIETSQTLTNTICLEHIIAKCTIIFADFDNPLFHYAHNNLNLYTYSCRYKLSDNKLIPVLPQVFLNYYENCIVSPNGKSGDKLDYTKLDSQVREDNKRKLECTPITFNTNDSDMEESCDNKMKSVVSPSKSIRLTPKNNFNPNYERLSNSVKRVLVDSFDESSSICYSVANTQCDEDSIKITLKVVDPSNIKVIPTKLTNDVMDLKSPIKLSHIKKVNNIIDLSSEGKMELLSREAVTPKGPQKISSRRLTKSAIKGDSSPQRTPAKISLRRSTRTVERKSYAKYFSSPVVCNSHPKENMDVTNHAYSTRNSTRLPKTPQIYDNGDSDSSCMPLRPITDAVTNCSNSSTKSKINLDNNSTPHYTPGSLTNSTRRSKRLPKTPQRYINSNDSDCITPKLTGHQTRSTKINGANSILTKADNTSIKSKRIRKLSNDSVEVNGNNKSDDISTECEDSDDDYIIPHKDNLRKNLFKSKSVNQSIECKTPKKTKANNETDLVKVTPTIRARMVRDGTITPSVQDRKMSILKDNTPLSKARSQLHVSYLPKALPCREKEFQDIENFLEGKLLDGCGGCMYISGVPGTGKTATVTDVIKTLQDSAKKKLIPSFTYVNINGMKMSEPRQAYVEIVKQLMGKTIRWEQAQTILENTFVKSKKKSCIIMVVDELDILCTKRQDVVYNLLDWPTKANTQLIVVTIANTMDLPERLLMGRVTSRLGLTRLTFQPYSHKQLQEIVTKRLMGTDAFNPDAVQLVARKVASVSGDARRALDICRRAAEIAEVEGKYTLVSILHVNQALNAMITQPKVQAIKRSSRVEKLLLQSVVAEVERTGVEETSFVNVFKMFVTLAALDGFQMVSRTTAMGCITKLGSSRLLLIDSKCNDIYQRIILNASSDDVHYALSNIDI